VAGPPLLTCAVAALLGMAAVVPAQAAASTVPGAAAKASDSGTVRGWGYNSHGQLGDGTQTLPLTPVKFRLPGGVKVTSVRAGCTHSLALTATGRVLASGRNSAGQLGIGNTTNHVSPVYVKLPAGSKVTAVRAGCEFSLALTSGGKVLAWGDNIYGQLGDGTTIHRETPVRVHLPTGTKVKAISAGEQFGLALTTTGHILAWGRNTLGQLGNGTTTDSTVPVRVKLPPGASASSVAAGASHVLALTGSGKAYGWGYNGYGQLGDGTTTDTDMPVRVHLSVPGTGRVTALFAGCYHSLALTSTGKVLAWGRNDEGQLGNGSKTDSLTAVKVALPAGTKATAVSAGCLHSLALTATGRVLAWGDNVAAELGNGTTDNSDVPVLAHLATGLVASAIGAGPASESSFAIVHAAGARAHAVAASTSTGVLRAWGFNQDGQLGDGTTAVRKSPVTVKLPSGTKVSSVRSGCDSSVAVTSTGRVLAWGVLWDVNNIAAVTHVPFAIKLPSGVRASTARAGCGFSLILTTTGHVLAWGDNAYGQLGNGTTTNSATPVPVKLPSGTKVKAISAGCNHGLALTTTGKLLAWGHNAEGQLGNGTTTDSAVPAKVAVPSGTKFQAVSSGCDHVLALTTTRKVLAWGDNFNGELGNGTTTSTDSPITVHVALPGTGQVASLFAGCDHSLALTTKGKVLAWGYNAEGQLGNGTTTQHDSAVKVKLPAGTQVKSITASCLSSFALTSAGHVLAWGDNSDGELGNGYTTSRSTPVKVHLPAGFTAAGMGAGPDAFHSFAIVRRAK
jgi:alpha-tubulin suppressor-like RCC1 family protein